MLTEIRVPKMQGAGWSFQKFNRRAQDWAIVGVAAWRRGSESGVGLVNMGVTFRSSPAACPRRSPRAHRSTTPPRLAAAEADPPADLNASRRVPDAPRQGAGPPGARSCQQLTRSGPGDV